MSLLEKIRNKNFVLTIVGAGRVGLPLGILFANAGIKTYLLDINADMLKNLERNVMPFKEKDLEGEWKRARKNLFLTSESKEAMSQSDVLIICVGTPLTADFEPNMSSLLSCLREIANYVEKEALVVIRSTVSPCTTMNVIVPFLKEKAKHQPYVAISPERILEGNAFEELRELPEIVGGADRKSAQLTEELLTILNKDKIIIKTDATSAEVAKLFLNVYRYMNFALANEFAIIADNLGLDCREIIRIANQSYKRGGIPEPGPSGGPCLYKDGHFLVGNLPFIDFARVAWHLNESVPRYIVDRLRKAVSGGVLYGVHVGVLGMGYKAGSDDTRYSPAAKIAECLRTEGSIVHVHDPNMPTTESLDSVLKKCKVLVVAVNHPEFKSIPLNKLQNMKVIFDCWGILQYRQHELSSRGCKYISFGGGQKL